MPYDEALADRIRKALGPDATVTERKMFGGLAFLREGKMFCGIVKDELMVRVGPERYAESLARPHVRPMDFTGRPMNGYVFVAPPGCLTEKAIRDWIERGSAFVATLPAAKRKRHAQGSGPGSPPPARTRRRSRK